jgi:hypothetical protein
MPFLSALTTLCLREKRMRGDKTSYPITCRSSAENCSKPPLVGGWSSFDLIYLFWRRNRSWEKLPFLRSGEMAQYLEGIQPDFPTGKASAPRTVRGMKASATLGKPLAREFLFYPDPGIFGCHRAVACLYAGASPTEDPYTFLRALHLQADSKPA